MIGRGMVRARGWRGEKATKTQKVLAPLKKFVIARTTLE